MKFEANVTVPPPVATISVHLGALAEMLRLPKGVAIVAVRPGADSRHCVLELVGDSLPGAGELIVDYDFQHTTVVTFKGFRRG